MAKKPTKIQKKLSKVIDEEAEKLRIKKKAKRMRRSEKEILLFEQDLREMQLDEIETARKRMMAKKKSKKKS